MASKTALIVGASRGLGLGLVERLLEPSITVSSRRGLRRLPSGKTKEAGLAVASW